MAQIEADCDRDNYMTAQEAKDYGLVDGVVKSRKEIANLHTRTESTESSSQGE